MQIYSPSMGRSADQRTLRVIQATGRTPCLCVPENEVKAYGAADAAKIIPVPKRIEGIAATRQFIMDWHTANSDDPYLVMMDDDLTFHVRRVDDNTKFTPAAIKDVSKMLLLIEKQLGQYAHVGVLAREGGNRITEPFVDCSRPLRIYAYDMRCVQACGARYTPGLVQDDFDMTLQLLRAGYANRIICGYVNDQVTSNAPGGASAYRTMQVHNASVERLARLHAPHVRVVQKHTKGAWQGQPRLDVVISWKKAYEEGRAKP